MPNTVLTFNVNDRQARAGFNRLKREVDELDREFGETRREAREAGEAIDRLADRSRGAARDIDRLGGVWRDTNGRLRDARGRFIAAGQGAQDFTRSLGGLRGILAGLGFAVAAREIFEFGSAAVQAAGKMEGLRRGLEAIEGSQADERLRDFNEIAKLPGLNTPQIIRYSNSLRAAGATTAEVDAIITSFGQSIVGLGGNAADTSRAMLQLTQAFGENKISQENFSTIKELIPSFNRFAQEVYNTDGSMDDLNKTFKASGQTLGQFLLPVLAKLRQEIPTAPVDSYARSVDALQEEFNQLQIAIGEKLLPAVSSASRRFAELFDNITNFIQGTNDAKVSVEGFTSALNNATAAGAVNKAFEDRIAFLQQEKTALDAAARGRANYFRFRGRLTEAGREYREITTELEKLQAAQGSLVTQSEYLQNVQDGLVTQARALTTEITALRTEIDGRTGKSVLQLRQQLTAKRAALAEVQAQLGTNANALRALASANTTVSTTVDAATESITNYGLAVAKLRADAEDARRAFADTGSNQQIIPNFDAALAASNNYYNERIRLAEDALAKETEGTEAYNQLQTQIFELGRQRITAQRQLESERTNILQNFSHQRTNIERQANNAVAGLTAVARAARETLRARLDFAQQIAAIPSAASADAQYGNFTAGLQRDFQETAQSGRSLLDVMRQIASFTTERFDLDARIPDPDLRQIEIDERIAAEAQGRKTIEDLRREAGEQGRQFLNSILRSEERDIQRSINARARQYRQFANLVSNTFLDLATGRTQSFQTVATEFIRQSLRIVTRAFIEHQIRLRLDDTLTAHKIANINKVAAAQAGIGLPGAGNLPGLPNISNLGSLLSGGGAALGVSALLFPQEIRNLTGGIADTVGNLIQNVASAPDKAFAPQQVFLKIGENETREITDYQDELREDNRV